MLIRYLGHAMFTIALETGQVIAMDPCDPGYGYSTESITADVCTVSHGHGDHSFVSMIKGSPVVINTPGRHAVKPGLEIEGYETAHDDKGGRLRGSNIVFLIRAEGLSVAHLGDLGHVLSEDTAKALRGADVLLVPVGGYYTIDKLKAKEVAAQIAPRIIIPMHYRTKATSSMPIEPIDGFLSLMGVSPKPQKELRVSAETVGDFAGVIRLSTPEGY